MVVHKSGRSTSKLSDVVPAELLGTGLHPIYPVFRVCANEIQGRRCYEWDVEELNCCLGRCGEVGAEGPTSATPSLG